MRHLPIMLLIVRDRPKQRRSKHLLSKRNGIPVPASLTKVQRHLFEQLNAMAQSVGLDYWNILAREPAQRTSELSLIKRSIVRGEIIDEYTFIDGLLAEKMCEYFLPEQSLGRRWKTKRFQRFNDYVLERLYLQQKLKFVKDVYDVPKDIAERIDRINALRNAMAHTYFPENLRDYRMKGRPAPRKPITIFYKGHDIFTPIGIETFKVDCMEAIEFLQSKMKRRKTLTSYKSVGAI